jgi:membrane-bound inhibitor of C-type lysozyme
LQYLKIPSIIFVSMAKVGKENPLFKILVLINTLLIIILILAFWQNTKTVQNLISTQQKPIVNASFSCDENKTIQALFSNNTAELNLSDGRSLMLIQGVSGSGTRYVNDDESITFWNKGNTAFIEEDSTQTYQNCSQPSE